MTLLRVTPLSDTDSPVRPRSPSHVTKPTDALTVPAAGVRKPLTGMSTVVLPGTVVTLAKPSKIDRSRSGNDGLR